MIEPRVYRFLRFYRQCRGRFSLRLYECRTCGELVGGADVRDLERNFAMHCMDDMNCALEGFDD